MKTLLRHLAVKALILKGERDVKSMFKNAGHAQDVNDRLLMDILKQNRNCEYGKKYNFGKIDSVEDFKKNVPVVEYKDIAEDVEKIYNENEQGILTSKRIVAFAKSSGSIGKPKIIPRTEAEIRIYTKYTVTRFLALAHMHEKKTGTKRSIPARGICTLCQHREKNSFGLPATNVADIAAKRYYFIYPWILNLPLGRQFSADEIDIKYANVRYALEDERTLYFFSVFAKNVAEIFEYMRDNWQMLVDDIENGTISEQVPMKAHIRKELEAKLKPNPKRAAALRKEFEKGFDATIAKRLWPNIAVISSIGTSSSFEPFINTMRKYTGDIPLDFSIYGASEGLFAAAYAVNEPGQLMLPDSCYYEFIEADEEEKLVTSTLSMSELEAGKTYEIIITNRSGFYRYRIKDIIKVHGFIGDCPIITFVYRRGQLLNINGEKTDVDQMAEAVRRLATDTGANIREWAVFISKGETQYCYTLAVETEDGRDMSGYSDLLETHLRDVNTGYLYYEKVKGLIDPPIILNQRPGSHEEWRRHKISTGATPEQIKPVQIFDTEEKMKFFLNRLVDLPGK